MQAALDDYNEAIELCPWSVDPLLNRCASVVRDPYCALLLLASGTVIFIFMKKFKLCAMQGSCVRGAGEARLSCFTNAHHSTTHVLKYVLR